MKKDLKNALCKGTLITCVYKLLNKWSIDLENNEKFYFDVLLEEFSKCNFSNASDDEKKILFEIKNVVSDEEFKNLSGIFKHLYSNFKKEKEEKLLFIEYEKYLKSYDFKAANDFASKETILSSHEAIYEKYRKECIKDIQNEIIYSISNMSAKKSKKLFYKRIKTLDDSMQLELGEFFETRLDIIGKLSNFNFKEADRAYKNSSYIKDKFMLEEYEKLKSKYIYKYYEHDFYIDNEKAYALSKLSRSVLLKARAGSGKTTALCLRTRFLAEKYDVDTDNILLLAFNKKAASKLKYDLNEYYGLEGFENARTFHSFAKSIYPDKKNIEDIEKKKFVENAADEILTEKDYKEKLYNFYKESIEPSSIHGYSLSNKEYVEFQKSVSQITLKGEIVKSTGEKYIADFLFEHGIEYDYEKIVFFEKDEKKELGIDDEWECYKPDFCIYRDGEEIYWEHWAIGEDEINEKSIIKNPSKYIKNAFLKRKFWKKRGVELIETSSKDSLHNRAGFEKILKEKLSKLGFKLKKVNKNKLYDIILNYNKEKFINTITTFMTQVKKNEISQKYIRKKMCDETLSLRTRLFLEIANKVYLKYENYLKENDLIDFDDLIKEATKRIIESKGECTYHIGSGIKIPVKSVKYLMIDEYQDFSKLFFNMVKAIEKFNPDMNIFCVGDDWQAINGFAGSDLYYFNNFTNLFEDSSICELLCNYRSKSEIIKLSNELMKGEGTPAVGMHKNEGGDAYVIDADKTFYSAHNTSDLAFKFKSDNPLNIKAKYLKTAHRIIRLNEGKSIFILSRVNRVHRADLSKDFLKALKRLRTVESKLVNAASIHQSKGLEADVVIIFQAVNGVLPLIHPDFEINMALGKSLKEIMDEEKRLLYVALTRAKEKIYILSESNKESLYLSLMNIKKLPFKKLTLDEYKR